MYHLPLRVWKPHYFKSWCFSNAHLECTNFLIRRGERDATMAFLNKWICHMSTIQVCFKAFGHPQHRIQKLCFARKWYWKTLCRSLILGKTIKIVKDANDLLIVWLGNVKIILSYAIHASLVRFSVTLCDCAVHKRFSANGDFVCVGVTWLVN